MVYDRVLTEHEIATTEAYLRSKFGIGDRGSEARLNPKAPPVSEGLALWLDPSDARSVTTNADGEVVKIADKADRHHFFGGERGISNDAAAEEYVSRMGADVRVFLLGWEHTWEGTINGREKAFAFPRVILEGKPENYPPEIERKIDRIAGDLRRLAKATRTFRPEVKISLGNSAVNVVTPLLDRGFRPGVEFDYIGTEEGIYWASPEQPATAIGNVNWWARAIGRHFGFERVPIFHSESVYFSTGPDQAAHYVRTYLLGFPYDSVYGFSGAMIDSGNRRTHMPPTVCRVR